MNIALIKKQVLNYFNESITAQVDCLQLLLIFFLPNCGHISTYANKELFLLLLLY